MSALIACRKVFVTLKATKDVVGVSVENLRWQMDDGEIVSFDELKARHPAPSN